MDTSLPELVYYILRFYATVFFYLWLLKTANTNDYLQSQKHIFNCMRFKALNPLSVQKLIVIPNADKDLYRKIGIS